MYLHAVAKFVADVSGSTWAAWVQAVGSVGAIYIAVRVARFQHEMQLERAENQAADKRIARVNAIGQARRRCRSGCREGPRFL
jgi:hypothetical protein